MDQHLNQIIGQKSGMEVCCQLSAWSSPGQPMSVSVRYAPGSTFMQLAPPPDAPQTKWTLRTEKVQDHPISYCLSETVNENYQLQLNLAIGVVVVV